MALIEIIIQARLMVSEKYDFDLVIHIFKISNQIFQCLIALMIRLKYWFTSLK